MVAPAGGEEARARRLQWRMLIGFVAGLFAGLAVYYGAADAPWVDTVTTYVAGPIGQIFLRLLFMLVIPLPVPALILGVAEMGEMPAPKTVRLRPPVSTVVVSSIPVPVTPAGATSLPPAAGLASALATTL